MIAYGMIITAIFCSTMTNAAWRQSMSDTHCLPVMCPAPLSGGQ
jgi:hypothetical protein